MLSQSSEGKIETFSHLLKEWLLVILRSTSLITDFKFTGKIESQTNIFVKVQFLLILHDFFSKTNRFINLYAKLLRKKNWSLIHGLNRVFFWINVPFKLGRFYQHCEKLC